MYLATNDVQSGDYQQSSQQAHTQGSSYPVKQVTKIRAAQQFDQSTMSKIGVYAASNVRNMNSYLVNSTHKKKFMHARRNSIVNPQVYSKTTGLIP